MPAKATVKPAQTPGRPEPKELTPVRLNSLAPGKAEVTQFLAADRKGRLFLLRGDTLEVFRLEDEVPFGAWIAVDDRERIIPTATVSTGMTSRTDSSVEGTRSGPWLAR